MADLKVLFCGQDAVQTDHLDWSLKHQQSHHSVCADERALSNEECCQAYLEENVNEANRLSEPWTATLPIGRLCKLNEWGFDEEIEVCYDEQFETAFPGVADFTDHKESQLLAEETIYDNYSWNSSKDLQEGDPECSLLSVDDFMVDSSEKSVDYGFIGAVTFLFTGISLVVISYTVPRDVKGESRYHFCPGDGAVGERERPGGCSPGQVCDCRTVPSHTRWCGTVNPIDDLHV